MPVKLDMEAKALPESWPKRSDGNIEEEDNGINACEPKYTLRREFRVTVAIPIVHRQGAQVYVRLTKETVKTAPFSDDVPPTVSAPELGPSPWILQPS